MRTFQKVLCAVGSGSVIVSCVWSLSVWIERPELSEMQVFLETWPVLAPGFLAAGLFMFTEHRRKRKMKGER
jgi:hypothetical protein